MRLTLRTMLAYMDDILDPEDAAELESKINESEFASSLVQRIRVATQKIRLGAPKLDGKGMGLDPNTVAAYLDNGLPQDRTPEFEKICLESEVHLAEVAACHQILALVLGERVDVPQDLRDKMCLITDRSAGAKAPKPPPAPTEASAAGGASGSAKPIAASDVGGEATASQVEARKRDLEVPDYLRTRSQVHLRSMALTVAITFLVVLVALRALGPFDASHPLLGWLATPETSPTVADAQDQEQQPASDPDSSASANTPSDDELGDDELGDDKLGDDKLGDDAEAGTGSNSVTGSSSSSGSEDVAPEVGSPAGPSKPPVPPMPAVDVAGDPLANQPPGNDGAEAGSAGASNGAPSDAATREGTPSGTDAGSDAAVEPAAASLEIGRFMTADQVVGQFDPATSTWFRLAARAPVRSGQEMLVLPTYRPQFALTSDIQMMVAGPAHLQFGASLEQQIPRVAMRYGRAMIDTIGPTGARIAFSLAGREGLAVLVDSESTLAVEVGLFLPPGSDPQVAVASRIIWIRALSGQVLWQGTGEAIKVLAGESLVLFNDQPPTKQAMSELPDWVQSTGLRDIDVRASRELEPLLDVQRSLSLSLEEVVEEHRQVEIRALATRALSYLNTFTPFVKGLNDEWQYSYWRDHFDALRDAIARGPETAAAVRAAFQKLRPEHAELLYRLVWGYSPDQLAAGADAELVALLEHPKMDVRALAFENLRRITGKTHQYRPEKSLEQQRRRWLLDWQQDLENKAITYEAPPANGNSTSAPPMEEGNVSGNGNASRPQPATEGGGGSLPNSPLPNSPLDDPSLPGPSFPGPSFPGPSLPGPSLPGPPR